MKQRILPLFDHIPAFNRMDNSGNEFLRAVQDMAREKKTDSKLAMALGAQYKEFTLAALKVIRLPFVDNERLLRQYNSVVNDRRQNLKDENTVMFTMLSFHDLTVDFLQAAERTCL
ncbi:hypothetical protein PR048_002562, partial [Dryococelus australis]